MRAALQRRRILLQTWDDGTFDTHCYLHSPAWTSQLGPHDFFFPSVTTIRVPLSFLLKVYFWSRETFLWICVPLSPASPCLFCKMATKLRNCIPNVAWPKSVAFTHHGSRMSQRTVLCFPLLSSSHWAALLAVSTDSQISCLLALNTIRIGLSF